MHIIINLNVLCKPFNCLVIILIVYCTFSIFPIAGSLAMSISMMQRSCSSGRAM